MTHMTSGGLSTLDAFCTPMVVTDHSSHTYDDAAAIDNAKRYVANDQIGAVELRKLVKTALMMKDPHG